MLCKNGAKCICKKYQLVSASKIDAGWPGKKLLAIQKAVQFLKSSVIYSLKY